MKKLLSLLVVLTLCCSMVLPAFAEEFVPSISYKDVPEVIIDPCFVEDDVRKELDKGCLDITPVSEALAVPEAERTPAEALLVEVYGKLLDGSMKLPVGGQMARARSTEPEETKYYIIRDLFDASLVCGDYHTDPSHVEELAKPGVCLEITFDLGIAADEEIMVMTYIDGVWAPIERITNNGDGTLTCLFEEICPIVFCVEDENQVPTPPTGDTQRQELMFWVIMMVATSSLVVLMVIFRRKFKL